MILSVSRITLCVALLASAAAALLPAETPHTVKTLSPAEHNAALSNPYMGWGLWAGPRYFDGRPFTLEYNTTGFGDDAPLFGWVLIDWMWSDLEPHEGRYDWKDLDTIINYWAKRNKQVELRIWITDDPGWNGAPGNEVCPEWLWAAGAKYRSYIGEGKSNKREPDCLDPSYERIYLPKARRFLTALAARYDRPDSAVMLWGAMGYGQWGEWHTMWSHYPWPNKDMKHAVLARIVNLYADVFKVRPLVISSRHVGRGQLVLHRREEPGYAWNDRGEHSGLRGMAFQLGPFLHGLRQLQARHARRPHGFRGRPEGWRYRLSPGAHRGDLAGGAACR
jgi:hypothetical protein